MCVSIRKREEGWGVGGTTIWRCWNIPGRVCVCINIWRQAAAGGVRSKTLVCIVCVSAPLAPCRVITWGNLLPNQHWHTQQQSTPPPQHSSSSPLISPWGPASWFYTISFSSFTEMANGWLLLLNTSFILCLFIIFLGTVTDRDLSLAILGQILQRNRLLSAFCGVFKPIAN